MGLGSAAASYRNGTRRSNTPAVADYIRRIQSEKNPTDFEEHLEGKAKAGEQIMLGLRKLTGVEITKEQQMLFSSEIKDLCSRGLVERNGDLLKLTFEGMFLANQAFMAFVGPFE